MIKWLGTVSSIIGAFLVASGLFFIGYIAFLIGSISWCIIGIKQSDKALITLNATFLVANILGFVNNVRIC
jgi:hypothetical protein